MLMLFYISNLLQLSKLPKQNCQSKDGVKMASTGVGFRWLDILEKEFDKACVELDTSLMELETDEPEVTFTSRQKIATLSSCFAQLTHKALTIFQNSAKIEAELVDLRAELVEARASAIGSSEELAPGNPIKFKLEAAQLDRENAALRETVLALHSELFGARLATKYLDKELAGRIQQLQLLGRDMRAEVRDSLWAQVEAEILVQRHKTLVRVCRGLRGSGGAARGTSPAPSPPPPRPHPRTVRVRRNKHLGLGISITGGREHGVPILISDLEAGGPAALTGQLYVGDAILAINDVDLTQACHKEAVSVLQSVKGDCELHVQFIATDDDDRLSEDHYRFPLYPEDDDVFCGEADGSGATPTAPRTPEYNRPNSEHGSRSECESPQYAEVPYRSPLPYPDYNSINNNLSILDMDDHSIKIETQEPIKIATPPPSPVLKEKAAPRNQRHLGRYRGVPGDSSSNDSPQSTPVHGRRPNLKKKKVKPLDWRSKGVYKAVEDDPQTSDEAQIIQNGFDQTPESCLEESAKEDVIETPCDSQNTLAALQEFILPPLPPQELVLPPLRAVPLKIPPKPNGMETFKDKAFKSRGFRIGLAKRVSETVAPLTNGEVNVKHIPLLAGEGDPDFGTPV